MKRIFKRLIFAFAFAGLLISNAEARSAKALMAQLDLEGFNEEQKEIIEEEVEAYTAEIDHLYGTNTEEYKGKIHELLCKLRDGFRVYNLTAKNEDLQKTIDDFETKSKVKVYVVSYVQGAFLNNLFQRLAELRYSFKKKGALELKYKFTKVTQNIEEGKFTGTCERKLDSLLMEGIKNKIDIPAAHLVNLSQNVDILESSSYEIVDQAARSLLNVFEDFICENCLPGLGQSSDELNYDAFVSTQVTYVNQDVYKSLVWTKNDNYHVVEITVTWTQDGRIYKGGSDNVLDCFYSFVNYFFPLPRSSFDESYSNKFSGRWQHTSENNLIKGEKKIFKLKYGYIRGVISCLGEQEKVDAFDAMILNLPFIKGKSHVEEFVNQHKDKFGESLDEILRIAYLISTIDADTWYYLKDKYKKEVFLGDVYSYAAYYLKLSKALDIGLFEALEEKIMSCQEAGTEEGQMTYLARELMPTHYDLLKVKTRIHILKVMCRGEIEQGSESIKGEEEIILQIMVDCPQVQVAEFLDGFLEATSSSDPITVLARLDAKMNDFWGDPNYQRFVEGLITLVSKQAALFDTKVNELLQDENIHMRNVNWQIERTVNRKIATDHLGTLSLSSVSFNKETGKITYQLRRLEKDEWWEHPEKCDRITNSLCHRVDYYWETYGQPVELSPFSLVMFTNYSSLGVLNEVTGRPKGEIMVVPAYFLQFLKVKDEINQIQKYSAIAVDLVTLASAPTAFLKTVSALRKAFIIFEVVNASANLAVNITPLGSDPRFVDVVDAYNQVTMVLGVTDILQSGVRKIDFDKVVRYSIKKSKESIDVIRQRTKAFVEAFNRNREAMYRLGAVNPDVLKGLQMLEDFKDGLVKKANEMGWGDWKDLGKTVISTIKKYKNVEFEDFANTVPEFKNGANRELAEQAFKLWGEEKWEELYLLFQKHNLNEKWPPYNGVKQISKTEIGNQLAGKVFDRFQGAGQINGSYASPVYNGEGVSDLYFTYDSRALSSEIKEGTNYVKFRFKDNIPDNVIFEYGEVTPWWGKPGLGDQIKSSISFSQLWNNGEGIIEILERLEYRNGNWIKVN